MPFGGSVIRAYHCQPDLIGTVDDVELSGFYLDTAAVYKAGCRYIEDKREEAKKRAGK